MQNATLMLVLLLGLASACDAGQSSGVDVDGPPTPSGTGGSLGSAGSGSGGTPTIACDPAMAAGEAPAPLSAMPWLHVEGNEIKDPNGNTVILRGVSLIDLGATQSWEGGIETMIDRLTDTSDTQGCSPGWATRVLRFPVYPPDGEFATPIGWQPGSTSYYDNVLRPAVDYARSKGIYAIIDWHYIDDTGPHRDLTNEFWADIAPRFAGDSHVLFELFNEPINGGSWASVKTDMQLWYDTVRAAAPDNLVLVGTPNWCQVVGPTASDPIDGTDVVYVAHMYPQHWASQSLRSQITTAAAVHPVFMSEWGFQEGLTTLLNGTITSYGAPFRQFVEQHRLSWTAWCASSSWLPSMFATDYTLNVGEGEMGGFAKDWLYDARNADLPVP